MWRFWETFMQIRRIAWLLLFYFFKLSTFNCSKCLPFSFCIRDRQMNTGFKMLNITILRRRRHFCQVRNRPYTWTIPGPAKSWFDIHYNDPTIPQEYFRQLLRVNRNTFETILHILGLRLERCIIIRKSSIHAKSMCVIITRFPLMKVQDQLAMGQIG